MNNNNPTLLHYTPEEFFNKIRAIVKEEVEAKDRNPNENFQFTINGLTEKPVFKAKEVCQMFQISRQTLHTWVTNGVIPMYKVNSRSYFLWEDIKKLLSDQNP